jgi:nucleoside phosphorylase
MPETAAARAKNTDVGLLILNYDPEKPQARYREGLSDAMLASSSARLPSAVPWPAASTPTPTPLTPAPEPTADLSKFKGYDAVVVTWTSAEAAALAALFTPGYPVSAWYEYRHNVSQYIPLVTGRNAPFNDTASDMARYYQTLGLYFPCRIGSAKVLLIKSGLHLDYDGPQFPVRKLMQEIAGVVQPSLFITTGTGGGIGADVTLGDVVVAGKTQFFCTNQFKNEPWCGASYSTSPLPAHALSAITPNLTKVNAARIPGALPTPKIWSGAAGTIVTTDFFGFDDSTDHYKLQGKGQACDMGDAMVGNALHDFPHIKWYAIRNASDPQIPNPSDNIETANKDAGEIYKKYGAFTTAASVIATWAVVDSSFNAV